MRKLTCRHTVLACYVGYITQAIVNNFAPLLFVTLQKSFALELSQITLLVTFNFLTQLLVDFLAAKFVDRIGYRPCLVAAHLFCVAGLVGLGVLPQLLPAYGGLLLAVVLYAVGGGLLEVLVSPVVESCPSDSKSAAMSLLHAFYCWGTMAVVILSTVLLRVMEWPLVAGLWALVPLSNAVLFLLVPMENVHGDEAGGSLGGLMGQRAFWLLALVMVCAGAAEQTMSQWASAFAESSLGVSKTVGDLAGPCFFALLMGLARTLHSKMAERIDLCRYIVVCACLCLGSYALAVLPLGAMINLLGCGLCGFSVGVFWPGTFSLATQRCRLGGTALFAMLALAGDIGCSLGPTVVGLVSGNFGGELKTGLCAAMVFPMLIAVGIRSLDRMMKPKAGS